jgi:transposase
MDHRRVLCGGRGRIRVARRYNISPQHLFAWRKRRELALLSLSADEVRLFAAVMRQPRQDGATALVVDSSGDIAIEVGNKLIGAARGVDPAWLRDVP